MAGKIKEEMVEVMLPPINDPNAPQQEFYSVNGKNYIIKRGIKVKVPASVAEVIYNGMEQERKAFLYIQEKQTRAPQQ